MKISKKNLNLSLLVNAGINADFGKRAVCQASFCEISMLEKRSCPPVLAKLRPLWVWMFWNF